MAGGEVPIRWICRPVTLHLMALWPLVAMVSRLERRRGGGAP